MKIYIHADEDSSSHYDFSHLIDEVSKNNENDGYMRPFICIITVGKPYSVIQTVR